MSFLTAVLVCVIVFTYWRLQSGIEDRACTELGESFGTVLDASDQVLAVFTFRINPADDFIRIFKQGQPNDVILQRLNLNT
ncbi:hypothetical protein ACFL2V_17185 [Pseudomonadota bacterium]